MLRRARARLRGPLSAVPYVGDDVPRAGRLNPLESHEFLALNPCRGRFGPPPVGCISPVNRTREFADDPGSRREIG